jgi:integrase
MLHPPDHLVRVTLSNVPYTDAAERRLAEVIQSGKIGSSKRLTFKAQADRRLEDTAKTEIKASTYQEYSAVFEHHLYSLLGSKPFVKVDRDAIKALIAKKKKEGCSQSTIRNILGPVRAVFFDAIDSGLVHHNSAIHIGKLNKQAKDKPKKKINPLTREEIQILLATAAKSKKQRITTPCSCARRGRGFAKVS